MEYLDMRNSSISSVEPGQSQGIQEPWAPTVITLALLVGAGTLVVGQMYVVLPLFLPIGAALGVSTEEAAITATVFGFAYAVGFLAAGPLSDRYGPRAMMVFGLAVSAFTTMLVGLSSSMVMIIGMRILQGFFAAMFIPAAVSYVAQHVRPKHRMLSLSCITSSMFAATIIMQLMAQFVAGVLDWKSVFILCAILMFLSSVAAFLLLQPETGERSASIVSAFGAIPRLIQQPRLMALYLSAMTLLGGFVGIYTVIALAGPAAIANSPSAQLALQLSGLPIMIAIPLVAPLLSRLPLLMRVSGGLFIAALAALAASFFEESSIALVLVMLVFVAATVAVAPALIELIGRTAGGNRGVATALYGFSMFIGASAGSQIVSTLAPLGFSNIVKIVALISLIGAISALTVRSSSDA